MNEASLDSDQRVCVFIIRMYGNIHRPLRDECRGPCDARNDGCPSPLDESKEECQSRRIPDLSQTCFCLKLRRYVNELKKKQNLNQVSAVFRLGVYYHVVKILPGLSFKLVFIRKCCSLF